MFNERFAKKQHYPDSEGNEKLSKVGFYFKYLDTYLGIINNGVLSRAMDKDPAVMWYRSVHRKLFAGWMFFLLICWVITKS